MCFSGTSGNLLEEIRKSSLPKATRLLLYSSPSILSCPPIKPSEVQSLPHAGALEAGEAFLCPIYSSRMHPDCLMLRSSCTGITLLVSDVQL